MNCQHCGKPFSIYPSEATRRKFCSLSCRKALSTKICKACGKEFSGRFSVIKKQRFCSVRCAQLDQVILICERCGKQYQRSRVHAKKSHYCSRSCQSNRVTYICEMCGKKRTVAVANTAKRFCGDECRLKWFSQNFRGENSPHWQGGEYPYYGPNWRQQRNKARYRDKHTCQHCGITRSQLPEELSVAHIVSFQKFGLEHYREANSLHNLITLCRKCHIEFDWENGTRK